MTEKITKEEFNSIYKKGVDVTFLYVHELQNKLANRNGPRFLDN